MAMITTMKKLKSGYINGTRVTLGNLGDFLSTSAITNLSFLGSQEDGYPDSKFNWLLCCETIIGAKWQYGFQYVMTVNTSSGAFSGADWCVRV